MGLFKRKDSDVWWMSYSVGRRQVRESTQTTNKQLAEELFRKRKVEVFEGRHFPDKKRNDLTLTALRDMWLAHAAQKKSLSDDKQRFTTLLELLGPNTQVSGLLPADVGRLKADLGRTLTQRGTRMAPATVNRHLALLRSALRLAERNGFRHRNPMAGVKLLAEHNERDRLCSEEELAQLVEAAYPKLRLAIVLGYHTGMRMGEICGLTWAQIDLNARTVRLRSASTKTGAARVVPLPSAAVDELRAWPRRLDGRLLDIDKRTLSPAFKRLCDKLGIHDLRFHDLRHTAATRLRRAGADLFTIAAITGHKDLQSLRRYNTITVDDLHKAVARLDAGTKPRG